jgi:hypothetical protein
MKLLVACNQCHAEVLTEDGTSPDRALVCGCCPLDHDHGQAANETGTPCRPVTISMVTEPGGQPAVMYFGPTSGSS